MDRQTLADFAAVAREMGDDDMTALALHATGQEWDSSGLSEQAQ